MKVIPALLFESVGGPLVGEDVAVSRKLLKDAPFMENWEGTDPETVLYEVWSKPAENKPGKLNWGISLLHPITVNGQCCMTRGHFHENPDADEYYWCESGNGYLALMNEKGEMWAEEMKPGSLHLIDGKNAHRLINTGQEDLKVICCWPGDAGHDYARVEAMPFPKTAWKENGEVVWK